ncbi:hypothetical protein QBC36DRAFT_389340 [Triangularia setosa]|uniref:NACHT domain-containing protein n=1 Tax=Triangularia setosa TaxID=2587417 RepID=A0AAN6W2I9_9PEZI|nr:hypothetical protein QBC36DRAFT_389340 [Podospora setosa]
MQVTYLPDHCAKVLKRLTQKKVPADYQPIDWYCTLTEHLLNKNNIAGGSDLQAVLRQLEGTVVEFYKALLLYQMKSLVFLRGMLNLDDWDGDLKDVTDAETIIQNDMVQFFQEQTRNSLGKLVSRAEGMETRLGDVHQALQDFISDLRVVDPQHNMEQIEKSKDELLDDVYKWILRTPEYEAFTNWDGSGSDCPPRRLLWMKGHAGTGKTMLMIGLIRQLSHQPVALSPALSFFFCQGTNTDLKNATAKYKESGADLFKDQNAFIALSECAEGQSDLIHLISTSLTLSQNVKWLISSRPEVNLLAALKDPGTNSLDVFNSLVELDTQRLAVPVNNDSVLAEVSHEVRKRAENTFLWVALAFKVLETVHGGYAVKQIEPQDCKTVLVVTSLAFCPLSISELSILSDLPLDIAETAVEMCGSFLTIAKGIVNLIHQPAKDYLEKNYKFRLQPAGPAQGQNEIVRRSTDAMSSMLRRNMYDLDLSFKPENMTPPDPDPLA